MCARAWCRKSSGSPAAAPKWAASTLFPFTCRSKCGTSPYTGKKRPTEVPLAHADSLFAQLKVISFLRTEFGFHSVILEHPVMHIAVGAGRHHEYSRSAVRRLTSEKYSDRATVRVVHRSSVRSKWRIAVGGPENSLELCRSRRRFKMDYSLSARPLRRAISRSARSIPRSRISVHLPG